jgi:creatinine amidohydrolase
VPDAETKPELDMELLRVLPPAEVRAYVGDGNYGGAYERPDADMLRIWSIAVEETRALLERTWDR